MSRFALLLLWTLAFGVGAPPAVSAQQTSYVQTNLVADQPGLASHTDSQLSNPWAIAFLPGNPFWIANNNGGTATTYDAHGNKQTVVVNIPTASTQPCNPGCPTGNVANSTTDFKGAVFLFDTEDGILASWNGAGNATKVVDNSAANAVYKGLALINNGSQNFLLAADFRSASVDAFSFNFAPIALTGSFTDPGLPAGYAPHGIHVVNNQIYVAYAMQDAAKHDPVLGAGLGVVDVFDSNGNFIRRFASGGTLNAPWGVVQAPANFGTFSNDILVGNFGDGTLNAFDSSGQFLGQFMDSSNKVMANPGLWDMVFGAGGTGDPNTLYFTAGGSTQTHGLFGALVPGSVAGTDFALSLSASSATVMRGSSTSLNIDASASGGFNSAIGLSCSGLPMGVTCSFSPASITPGGSAATSKLTVSAGSIYKPIGYVAWMPFGGLGLLGLVFGTRRKSQGSIARRNGKWALGSAVLLLGWLLLWGVGCGSYSSNRSTNGSQTVMVVGTSGTLTHSAPLSLTIQ